MLRKPLLERADLPEELFDSLMASAVYDPDPSFCRWFVEPAIYVFGRRRVRTALVEYLRTGTYCGLGCGLGCSEGQRLKP